MSDLIDIVVYPVQKFVSLLFNLAVGNLTVGALFLSAILIGVVLKLFVGQHVFIGTSVGIADGIKDRKSNKGEVS